MKKFFLIVFTIVLSCNCVFAMTGLELAQKVYDRDDGDDAYFKTEMILIDKNGNERRRALESYTKDYDSLVKSYLEFLEPPDIKGTRFLSWENQGKDDTQYLYLPELGRARRIVSSQKSLQFVNTDFTYEDMQRRKPKDDEHIFLGTARYLGRPVYLLGSIAKPGTSQYAKRISCIDQESLVPVAINFLDRKNRIVKKFRVEELKKVDGIWTGMRVEMREVKADHKTEMNILKVKYNKGVDDQTFELRNLEK